MFASSNGIADKSLKDILKSSLQRLSDMCNTSPAHSSEGTDESNEESLIADMVASQLVARVRRDLGRAGSRTAFLAIQAELIDCIAHVAQECVNRHSRNSFRALLCIVTSPKSVSKMFFEMY